MIQNKYEEQTELVRRLCEITGIDEDAFYDIMDNEFEGAFRAAEDDEAERLRKLADDLTEKYRAKIFNLSKISGSNIGCYYLRVDSLVAVLNSRIPYFAVKGASVHTSEYLFGNRKFFEANPSDYVRLPYKSDGDYDYLLVGNEEAQKTVGVYLKILGHDIKCVVG